ncbi:hypothetical protein GCM10009828_095930 [Actinoplanes couchii]|uniref:Uncharacterized protein n=1 Tax=Actinoplanes couchii TaxID=403638 RepID=A0ABQ3XE96_9ACTN|nr:hypothetical protein Aco03nite_052340 [Actinoplanes couchii]
MGAGPNVGRRAGHWGAGLGAGPARLGMGVERWPGFDGAAVAGQQGEALGVGQLRRWAWM